MQVILTFWTRERQRPASLPLQTSTFVPQALSVWGLAVRSLPRYLAASPGQRPYKPRGCWGWWLPMQYSPFSFFFFGGGGTKIKPEARLCRSDICVHCASILELRFDKASSNIPCAYYRLAIATCACAGGVPLWLLAMTLLRRWHTLLASFLALHFLMAYCKRSEHNILWLKFVTTAVQLFAIDVQSSLINRCLSIFASPLHDLVALRTSV